MVALTLLGCHGDPGDPGPCTSLTWEHEMDGVFTDGCTACHASALAGAARHGAPEGVNFDTLAGVRDHADQILVRATGDAPTMPPAGQIPDQDRDWIAEWLGCGAPGTEVPRPADPCATPTSAPAGSEPTDLCADSEAVAVTGSIELVGADDVALPCLCRVDGDLVLTGGARVDLPALVRVGGALRVDGDATVVSLSAPRLEQVGGDLTLNLDPALASADLHHLADVGGALAYTGLDRLAEVDLRSLRTVGQAATFADLPLVTTLYPVEVLESVGGDLVVRRDGVLALDDFRLVASIGGDLVVEENDHLTRIDGFWVLPAAHTVRIVDNPRLGRIVGFDQLASVDRLEVTGNGALEVVEGPLLVGVGALVIRQSPGLVDLSALLSVAAVDGDLELDHTGLASMVYADGLQSVGGALRLTSNPDLADVSALLDLGSVGGDLVITGNASLPAADAEALGTAIGEVGGTTTISGNGP